MITLIISVTIGQIQIIYLYVPWFRGAYELTTVYFSVVLFFFQVFKVHF